MSEDKLLQRYVKDGSDAAFGEIVRRNMSFVYSVCRRSLGDVELANDVTQAVFLLLAEKARTLRPGTILTSWLFQTAHFACRNAVKIEARRRHYEREAVEEMMRDAESVDPVWCEVAPKLDGAVAALGGADRNILLLRYADGLSMEEAGAVLGISAAAAQRRASRAVQRLRGQLARGGIVVSVAALTVILSNRMIEAAPAALAAAMVGIGSSATTAVATTAASALAHSLSRAMIKEILVMKAVYFCSAVVVVGLVATGGHLVLAARSHIMHVGPSMARTTVKQISAKLVSTETVTGPEVAKKSADAYAAVRSMEVTVTAGGAGNGGSSKIAFVSPDSLRIDGTVMGGEGTFEMLSNSAGTWVMTNGSWQRETSAELGIGACTGISGSTSAVVPGLLIHSMWGDPFIAPQQFDAAAPQETVDGVATYHIRSAINGQMPGGKAMSVVTDYWVDRKSFMLVESRQAIAGYTFTATYGQPKLNAPIPASTFAQPAGSP